MKKKILIGSSIAVALLVLVSVASSINAIVSKSVLEPALDTDILIDDNATPSGLVFQLIAKLRNNKQLQELVEDNDAEVDIQVEIFILKTSMQFLKI